MHQLPALHEIVMSCYSFNVLFIPLRAQINMLIAKGSMADAWQEIITGCRSRPSLLGSS